MKMTIEMLRAQERMRPGIITARGFLGEDIRNISEIIEEDDYYLSCMGVTIEELIEKMRVFRESGMKGLGETVSVQPFWEVRIDEARGVIVCPFSDGAFPKTNTTVTLLSDRKTVTFSDLTVHLIAAHHFFQGRGSPFRYEPEAYIHVFRLKG
jgi:hypothetical protein